MTRINCFLHGLALLMGICMGSNISAQTTLAYWNLISLLKMAKIGLLLYLQI